MTDLGPALTPFESSGFSIVLLAREPVRVAVDELLDRVRAMFDCDVERVDVDPLPLGDRDDVLAALEQVEPVVAAGRIAAWHDGEVLKAVTPQAGIVVVESVASPFYSDVDSVRDSIEDVRLQKALDEHRAFAEVGLLGLDVVDRPFDAKRRACRLAARLCGPSVSAIAVPDQDLLACADPEVLDALCSREPFVWPSLVRLPSARRLGQEDAAFDRATTEARSRWPVFAQAFAMAEQRESFAVKVAVYEGEVCENLWFRVHAIDGERAVECVLQSQPIYLRGIRPGELRRFSLDAVLDWVHAAADGSTVGGFTLSR